MNVAGNVLPLWGLQGASHALVAARENQVFLVESAGAQFALRLHRVGYRIDAELRSELDWMAALEAGGLRVPCPVPALDGALLQTVDGVAVDLLTWLDGMSIGAAGQPLTLEDPVALFGSLGRELARLHTISDEWDPPNGFVRCAWDRDGLVGNAPVWGRFWENPTLSREERSMFEEVRDVARSELASRGSALDYGLIHADLVPDNVLVDGGRVQFIDFDDGGYGYRLFDLAGALVKNLAEPSFVELKDALISGYRSARAIDTDALDLMLLLRACTYVGWIVPRMNEAGAEVRNRRSRATATRLARTYLNR